MNLKKMSRKVENEDVENDPGQVLKSKHSDVFTRIVYSIVMLLIFLTTVSAGISAGAVVVLAIVAMMFKELSAIDRNVRKERQLPWGQPLKIYFFIASTAICLFCGLEELLRNRFSQFDVWYPILSFVGFCIPIVGFIAFIASLKIGFYRYQIIRLSWTVIPLMIIESQFYFEIRNMVRGMIWFLLPAFCVIVNDSWAYICGKLFGRTKLLALSPKKTVEGFTGALLVTVFWSFWFCGFLSRFPTLYCPAVGFSPDENSSCQLDPVFISKTISLPSWIQWLSAHRYTTITASEAQFHALVLGAFASLIAPFGGFFASAVKRSFHLKDFGNLIPGHGGVTDRMDCQGLMAMCTFFYLETFVFHNSQNLEKVLHSALLLPAEDRLKLCARLNACGNG